MHTLEEMSVWGVDDALAHTELEAAKQGLDVHYYADFEESGVWVVKLTNAEGEEVWQDQGFEQRILLLSAYGWLCTHNALITDAADSVWVRRQEITADAVTRRVNYGPMGPDPEDIDPDEIAAMWAKATKSK